MRVPVAPTFARPVEKTTRVGFVELDAAVDDRALGHDGLGGTVVDEVAADARPGTDHEFLGTHHRIPVNFSVDPDRSSRRLQLTVGVATEAHASTGQCCGPPDHGRRTHRNVPARQTCISAHDGVELDVAAGGIQVVAHAAADRDLTARHDEIAPNLTRDRNLAAGQEGVAIDGVGEIEHAARGEPVRSEGPGDGILAVVFDAAAADARQSERDQRHG